MKNDITTYRVGERIALVHRSYNGDHIGTDFYTVVKISKRPKVITLVSNGETITCKYSKTDIESPRLYSTFTDVTEKVRADHVMSEKKNLVEKIRQNLNPDIKRSDLYAILNIIETSKSGKC